MATPALLLLLTLYTPDAPSHPPAPLPRSRGFPGTPLVAGSRNTLAIDAEGQLWSWGWNYRGTLGHGHRGLERKPRRVQGLKGVRIVQVCLGARGWGRLWEKEAGVGRWRPSESGSCRCALGAGAGADVGDRGRSWEVELKGVMIVQVRWRGGGCVSYMGDRGPGFGRWGARKVRIVSVHRGSMWIGSFAGGHGRATWARRCVGLARAGADCTSMLACKHARVDAGI